MRIQVYYLSGDNAAMPLDGRSECRRRSNAAPHVNDLNAPGPARLILRSVLARRRVDRLDLKEQLLEAVERELGRGIGEGLVRPVVDLEEERVDARRGRGAREHGNRLAPSS